MTDAYSYSTVIIGLVFDALNKAGYDTSQLRQQFNLTDIAFGSELDRISQDMLINIWSEIENLTQDPDIGLHLAEHCNIGLNGVVIHLVASSDTLLEGMNRMVRYKKIIGNSTLLSITEDNDKILLNFDLSHGNHLKKSQADFFALYLYRIASTLSHQNIKPSLIKLSIAKPEKLNEYERLFPCPVVFSSPNNAIQFESGDLNSPLQSANPNLLKIHEGLASGYIKEIDSKNLIETLEKAISLAMMDGPVNIAIAAKRLAMSERQLKEALSKQGTSFSEILESLREKMSIRLLQQPEYTITDVAYLCGYSESSAFVRAFKRWKQVTPSDFRKQLKA
ncbi:AraC family transcriptional regulator [Maricurvus nonylphenolicus]|uniref:AraC family transcriptional regulator n=1 Tax=Maricurvus nonylphenolicus TaxID=1008307 RepID=UPI0036F3F6A4